MDNLVFLKNTDPQIAQAVRAEQRRQATTLELIASENHVSAPVLEALGTVLTDKYAEGYPGKRWYRGCENVDTAEQIAIERAIQLFGAEHANVQPHSGSNANLAVYIAALKPGQKIMGMDLAHGGHLSHGKMSNISGIVYKSVNYGVRKDTETLDMDEVRKIALRERPDILVCGASAYPRQIDFDAFGQIARQVGCPLLSDIAHIAGLVVAGLHPDPVPHSDFVTTTNHKTLRGPRGGIIFCKKQWADKIDAAVFPGIQGGPLMHVIAAKAVALAEAMHPGFKHYAQAILDNAAALAQELMARGWRLVTDGTDNHLMLMDLRPRRPNLTGHEAAIRLTRANLVVNKNAIPFDPRGPLQPSGIRLGTPAVTSRGLRCEHMEQIAAWIDQVLTCPDGEQEKTTATVAGAVGELCSQYPVPNSSY
ncbi:MAG: serine hydroxymethyltransferase [Phycisphaerae bacterium]|jgi:glycine hydroxymethyltransferase|nr:serine hydroxymethyltransferase [Phycisphaerae bacterium]MDP7636935.1 serine hydroxymethyltransferase [Phycisphaerae bacterium]